MGCGSHSRTVKERAPQRCHSWCCRTAWRRASWTVAAAASRGHRQRWYGVPSTGGVTRSTKSMPSLSRRVIKCHSPRMLCGAGGELGATTSGPPVHHHTPRCRRRTYSTRTEHRPPRTPQVAAHVGALLLQLRRARRAAARREHFFRAPAHLCRRFGLARDHVQHVTLHNVHSLWTTGVPGHAWQCSSLWKVG